MRTIKKSSGRIELEMQVIEMGDDCCVVLTGGEAHLGAVTAGSNAQGFETVRFGSHKEFAVTEYLQTVISKRFDGRFSICCGIHYDRITKEEIETVFVLSEAMAIEMFE